MATGDIYQGVRSEGNRREAEEMANRHDPAVSQGQQVCDPRRCVYAAVPSRPANPRDDDYLVASVDHLLGFGLIRLEHLHQLPEKFAPPGAQP